MLTYIITRFSICDYEKKSFVDTRNLTELEYKEKIFNSDRLDYKFKSFELVTIPSVLNQTNQNYIWYIYSSIYLPEIYKERLLELTNPHENIICLFIETFKEFNKISYIKSKFCTVRLDDDDGLSKTFIQDLNKYENEKKKTIISFTSGTAFTIDNEKIVYGNKIKSKNNAQGLCAIGYNIYDCGNHTKVHTKYKVIYNDKPNMYILNCSIFCDTARKLK